MNAQSAEENPKTPESEENLPKKDRLAKLIMVFGAGTALLGVIGLTGLYSGITLLSSIYPGYKPIAFSAALAWIVLGIILAEVRI